MSKKYLFGAAMLLVLALVSCGNKNSKKETDNKPEPVVTHQSQRLLLIVDPQVDFTTGSLAVPDGPAAMETLAQALKGDAIANYTHIAVTQDFHPADHSSFVDNGGIWPPHCVQGTEGVEVYPALKEVLDGLNMKVEYLHKGDVTEKEEYSILQNEITSARVKELLNADGFTGVDICGIASDYCVYETLNDLLQIYPSEKVRVVMNCVAAVSDNDKLPAFMKEKGIEAIEF